MAQKNAKTQDRFPLLDQVGHRPAPSTDSATSQQAAKRLQNSDVRMPIWTAILLELEECGPVSQAAGHGPNATIGGATAEELADAVAARLGRPVKETTIHGRICGQRAELANYVMRTDYKRLTRAGYPAYVYALTARAEGHIERIGTAARMLEPAARRAEQKTETAKNERR